MLHFFVVYYSIVLNSKYRYNTKNIKNMPAVGKDHNSWAKEHDQNSSFFFFVNYRVIVQRYSFLTA